MASRMAPRISFHLTVGGFSLPQRTRLKSFLAQQSRGEGKPLQSLAYIFLDDEGLLSINRQFLNHDTYTDIITFELGEEETMGEIYISADRVKDNANIHGVSAEQEFLRVMFHGALHLCGYRDKKKSEITVMRAKEDEYLRLYSKYK